MNLPEQSRPRLAADEEAALNEALRQARQLYERGELLARAATALGEQLEAKREPSMLRLHRD